MQSEDRLFYTVTMARIHADQGNLGKAAEIYAHLLRRDPQRDDLAEELAEVEDALREKDPYDLAGPISQWVELMLRTGRIRDLALMRQRLRRLRRRWA